MKPKRLTGLIAAPFTAFHADGTLNLAAIEGQSASLIGNQVAGVFICGTTGEGASMTTAERMDVAARWVDLARGKLRIVVHVGHNALEECRTLAAHAQELGADAIGCLAPSFFKPAGVEELVGFCAKVAEAAPELPFYYYHIPSMTGVSIPAVEFLRVGSDRIPSLAGVKFTFENLMDYAACVRFAQGRYDIVFGRDEMLLAGLSLGAQGAIGSTYNFAAPVYHRIIRAFEAGDLAMAQAEQARANAIIDVFVRYGGLPAGKAIMNMIGVDCGPTRLPLATLSEDRKEKLREELKQLGFFSFCSQPL